MVRINLCTTKAIAFNKYGMLWIIFDRIVLTWQPNPFIWYFIWVVDNFASNSMFYTTNKFYPFYLKDET